MGYGASRPFITSVLELKLDTGTLFEWHKHSSSSSSVSHYNELPQFANLRAQATEQSISEGTKRTPNSEMRKSLDTSRSIQTLAVSITPTTTEPHVICKVATYLLFTCREFRSLAHD